jgi:hypothetical protein
VLRPCPIPFLLLPPSFSSFTSRPYPSRLRPRSSHGRRGRSGWWPAGAASRAATG